MPKAIKRGVEQKRKIMKGLNSVLVQEIAKRNSLEYNIDKCLEEIAELNVELIKMKTKSPKFKPPVSKIHEEAAHAILRISVIANIYGQDETEAQLVKKQGEIAARMEKQKPNDL